jgi:hypothetical protein
MILDLEGIEKRKNEILKVDDRKYEMGSHIEGAQLLFKPQNK